ncbi:hypothetical protein [Mumia flava]|uniref:hypothetical protein n=1 Tax=Mumia flava TaxID=1348852 RepID=UPI001476DE84|nr:hypothetical protein [Mumia flava]
MAISRVVTQQAAGKLWPCIHLEVDRSRVGAVVLGESALLCATCTGELGDNRLEACSRCGKSRRALTPVLFDASPTIRVVAGVCTSCFEGGSNGR